MQGFTRGASSKKKQKSKTKQNKEPKKTPANAREVRETGLTPQSGRSPGGGHGSPLQYYCLENPTDRRAWRAAVHGITKSMQNPNQLLHGDARG